MKKIISAAILLVLFNFMCLYHIYYINCPEEIEPEFVVVDNNLEEVLVEHTLKDNTVYKSLTIKDLSVTDPESNLKVKWFYNSANKEYYLYLPKSFNRNKLKAKFYIEHETIVTAYDESGKVIGESYNSEETNIFKADRIILKLETNVKKVNEYIVNIYSAEIPTVFVNLDGGSKAFKEVISSSNHSVSKTGVFTVLDTNGEVTKSEMKKFKGRGNATWTRPKKPFALKIKGNKALLGMKCSNDWLLLANYPDGSLSRNAIFLYFAEQIGLDFTPEYRPVDVYVNNEYYGSYILTSKVESDESRVDNNDEYLLEIDNHPDGDEVKLKSGNYISIKNPDLDNLYKSEIKELKSTLKKQLDKLEDLIKDPKTTKKELEKYMDLESFAKYYWVQELSLNFDSQRGSNYFYYLNGKVYAGPIWDMDNTLNRSYKYAKTTGYYTLDNYSLSRRINNNWYRGLFNKKYFQEIADEVFIKYVGLFDSLEYKLDEYYKTINLSAEMNYIRWPYSKMMVQDPRHPWRRDDKSYIDSQNNLKNELVERITWYKKQYNIYDKFQYEIDEDGEKIIGTFSKNLKATIDSKYVGCKVKIYGISKDGKSEELKTIKLENDNNDIEIILTKKTTSKYKTINQSKYLLSIEIN